MASDSVVIPPGQEQHADEPQVLSTTPKSIQVPGLGQSIKPSTGELPSHKQLAVVAFEFLLPVFFRCHKFRL